jgi:hypothetical protein
LQYSTSLGTITTAAQTDAATNGFPNNGTSVTVTVNNPPLSGGYLGNANAVEVIVAKTQPTFFAKVFGLQSDRISARAVGLLSSASRNCIFALDTSNSAITQNNANIQMPKCGMISNGGLLFNQGTINAAAIGHAGSNITVNNTVFQGASPKLSVPAADPCATVTGCAYLTANPPTSGQCVSQTTYQNSGTITLSPGRYCNQVIVENGSKVIFNPGVYDFENGFTNNSVPDVEGSGVTFYIKGGNFIQDPSGIVNLSAPSSGNYAGVLVYQPASNSGQFTINSGSGSQGWSGMIYLPGAEAIVDGALSNWLLVVAYDVLLNGGGVNDPNAAFPNYSRAVLAE